MRKQLFLLISILSSWCCCMAQVPAQNRTDLEKERASIQKEIEDVKRSLDITHKNRNQTLGQLNLLQKRLRLPAGCDLKHQPAVEFYSGGYEYILAGDH